MDDLELRNAISKKITDAFGWPFTMDGCEILKSDPDAYCVTGDVIRYGEIDSLEARLKVSDLSISQWFLESEEYIGLMPKPVGSMVLGPDIIVSDPAYLRDLLLLGDNEGLATFHTVRPGRWYVEAAVEAIDSSGPRFWQAALYHSDFRAKRMRKDLDWKSDDPIFLSTFRLCFIENGYETAFKPEFPDDCKKATTEKRYAFLKDGRRNVGFVCETGYNDGAPDGYCLQYAERDATVVALSIRFG